MNILEAALKYAGLGWYIFPCKNKIPVTKRGFKNATTEIETITKWFETTEFEIGVATGKQSGIFVIDIDSKREKSVKETLAELQKRYGDLPDTKISKTRNGGFHFFYKYPDSEIRCKAGLIKDVDIRGEGGYVILPPSPGYEWTNEQQEIVDIHDQFLTMRKEEQVPINLNGKEKNIPESQRNSSIHRIGVRLRKLGLQYEEIKETLQQINKRSCKPSLPEAEIETIVKQVSAYEQNIKTDVYSDIWNARQLSKRYGNNFKYCNSLGGWYVWNNSMWERGTDVNLQGFVKSFLDELNEYAENLNPTDKLHNHIRLSSMNPKIQSMIHLTKSEPNILVKEDIFDNHVYLLNCQNGTLNLLTQKLLPHNREDFITKTTSINYNKEAKCPKWKEFLDSIFLQDKELINYIQKIVGYSLSDSIDEQCIFILYGVGSNGKSTFTKHVANILGSYSQVLPSASLLEKKGDVIPNDIAMLRGSRFVIASEPSRNRKLSEEQIKTITGGDTIAARFLHKEYFKFKSTFKIFLTTNHLPEIKGIDRGIWRRIITIPFEYIIEDEKRDLDIDNKLYEESEGILAWAVEGFKRWKEEGLQKTERMQSMYNEYQDDSDILKNFMEEQCVLSEDSFVSHSKLYKALNMWSKNNGFEEIRNSEYNDFMKKKGFGKTRASKGFEKGKRCWKGLRLLGEEEESYDF